MPCASARSTPVASTLLIGAIPRTTRSAPSWRTSTTMRPGVLPVDACGSPESGIGPRSDTYTVLPSGASPARSGVGSAEYGETMFYVFT